MLKLFEALKKAKTEIITILIVLLVVFFVGFIIGRKTISYESETLTLTPIDSILSSTGSGIMTPRDSTVIDTSYQTFVDSIKHFEQFKLIWFEYDDPKIRIHTRGLVVDSVQYDMKKEWFDFSGKSSIESLSVYGVAPESVKVKTAIPEKNFLIAATLTIPEPKINFLIGYKHVLFHSQIPTDLNFQKTQFGIGYMFQF